MKLKLYCFALVCLLTLTSSLSALEFWIFSGDWTYRINAEGGATIGSYSGSQGDVVVPSAFGDRIVTEIGEGAFSDNLAITSVTIPSGVKTISLNAFSECLNLTGVTLPNGLITIGEQAFYGCTNLSSITIPETVTTIGQAAFSSCFALQSINIPEDVTSIEPLTFSHCSSLSAIHIPENVTEIWSGAFWSCNGLTTVSIPQNVTTVWERAFAECYNLRSAIFLGDAPEVFGNDVFDRTSPAFSIQYQSGRTGWTSPVWNGYLASEAAQHVGPEAPEAQGSVPSINQHPISQSVDLYQSINLSVIAYSSSTIYYQWFKDGQPIPGAIGSSYAIASVNENHAGYYFCRVSNSTSSVDSEVAVLEVASYIKVPLYRFSRNDNPSHFFTAVEAEKDIVLDELGDYFTLEGISHYVVAVQQHTAVPVYRLYNSLSGAHFYTASEVEKNHVLATLDYFSLEGVAFYVFLWPEHGTLPVYRFYVPETGSHFFTIDEAEKNFLVSSGQQTKVYEGIAWYAYPNNRRNDTL